MARTYRWPDGSAGHSISWAEHQSNLASQAAAAAQNKARSQEAEARARAQAQGQVGPAKGIPAGTAPGTAPTAGGPAQIIPDAQYLAEAAQAAFQRQTQIDAFNQQSQQDRGNRDEAIRRIIEKMTPDLQSINEGANRQGLFYSGQLTKRRDDYNKAVERQKGDLNTGFQQREDARTAAIKALNQGAPLEDAVALAASAGRQVTSDTAAADANALVLNPISTASPAQRAATFLRTRRRRR